jgi:hypothetical protein
MRTLVSYLYQGMDATKEYTYVYSNLLHLSNKLYNRDGIYNLFPRDLLEEVYQESSMEKSLCEYDSNILASDLAQECKTILQKRMLLRKML